MRRGSAVAFALCAVLLAALSGLATTLSHTLVDARFRLFPRDATGTIALVAIDPKSIDEIGVWPWPRTVHAELLEKLEALGVADIVFDVDFSSRSNDAADAAFAEALRKAHGSVVLASFVQKSPNGARHERVPLPEFREHTWLAMANVSPEPDGLIRSYSYGGEVAGAFEPAMGAMLAATHRADAGSFGIDFSIRAESIPVLSLVDVLSGKVTASELAGKKVVIGATAVELGDRFNVPNGTIIPGPSLQVLAAETLLQDRALYWTSHTVTILGLALIALIIVMGKRCLELKCRMVMLVGAGLVTEALATLSQVHLAVLVDTSLWHVALLAGLVAALLEELDFRGLMARLADARFRHVARAVGEGLVCTDEHGKILYWNPGASRIFGIPAGEAIGRPILDLVAEVSTAELTRVLDQGHTQSSNLVLELVGKQASGTTFALEAGLSSWQHDGRCQFAFVLRDVTARKQEQDRIRFLAEHDPMTGLINRSKLCEELTLLTSAENPSGLDVVVFGVDGLKALNDVLGQDRGDRALIEIGSELRRIWSDLGQVARVSGDEFAVVVSASTCSAHEITSRIEASLAFSVLVGDRPVPVTLSAGSSACPKDGTTADVLLANAALALGDAKARGPGSYAPYGKALRDVVERHRSLEAKLKIAYERGEFELFYQPQVLLESRRVIGAEALIRWRDPERGLVSPGEFMPILEKSAVAGAVGLWVVEEAIAQAALWHQAGYDLRVGINLSQALLHDPNLPRLVAAKLAAYDCPARLVELEITETIALEDNDNAVELLREIQASGVHIAFDDFGTGFASLTTLKRFPLNRLKIDQSFVRDMLKTQDDRSIVSVLIALSSLLDLHVIAEGIENEATAEALRALGCEEGQGYFFGRPMPAGEFLERLCAGTSRPVARRQDRPSAAPASLSL